MSLSYKLPSYQSIFDALVTVEVPLDSIVSVLKESDLDLDSDLSGETIVYESTQVVPVKGGQKPIPETITSLSYTTNATQNIYDVCLMTVGDLNKIVSLVSSNGIFNSINDAPNGVKTVTYESSNITDSGLILAFKKSNINITTGNIRFMGDETGFLLQEDGYYVLQENASKIIL